MIKNKLNILALLFSSILFSCGGDNTADLNTVIDMTNSALEEMEEFSGGNFYEEIQSCKNEMDEYQLNPNKNIGAPPIFTIFNKDNVFESVKTASANLKSEDSEFADNVVAFMGIIDELEADSKELKEYIDAENYKDDNLKKGNALIDKLLISIDSFYDIYSKIETGIDKISASGGDSENPTSSQALNNMDKDLKTANTLYEKIEEMQSIDELTSIESDLQGLMDDADKHAKGETELEILKPIYEMFYDNSMREFTNNLKIMIRDSKSKSISDEDLPELTSNLLDDYNTCVDSYNSLNEQIGNGIQ